MLASLLGAIHADVDRQVGWVGGEVRRQIRHAGLVGVIYGLAALAVVGALAVGLIALHFWLARKFGPRESLGMIGGGLLLLAALLVLLAIALRRPRLGKRPALQVAQPAALFGALGVRQPFVGGEHSLRLATDALRQGTRSELLGALAIVAVAGVFAGRGMRRSRSVEK